MTISLTANVQDYLKTIYTITREGKYASTTALAARLGFAPASVTGMLQKLSLLQLPLVVYKKHQGAILTFRGKKVALEVLRHHRLLETWLVYSLGFSWDAVHEQACKMEHVISEEFEATIAEQLGHPSRDPHGAPIPSEDLVMPSTNDVLLSSLRGGERAIIRHVHAREPSLLHRLRDCGLLPGVELHILTNSSDEETMTVNFSGHPPFEIGKLIQSQVSVEII
jgi:DtxR family Mn-dependent transcriptional regulator